MTAVLLGAVVLTAGCGGSGKTATAPATQAPVKTPKACVEALGYADDGFDVSGDFAKVVSDLMGVVQKAFTAAANLDTATLEGSAGAIKTQSGKISALTDKVAVLGPKYTAARDACLAAR